MHVQGQSQGGTIKGRQSAPNSTGSWAVGAVVGRAAALRLPLHNTIGLYNLIE